VKCYISFVSRRKVAASRFLLQVLAAAIGTSPISIDVRLESARWLNADIDQVAVTNRDVMRARPKEKVLAQNFDRLAKLDRRCGLRMVTLRKNSAPPKPIGMIVPSARTSECGDRAIFFSTKAKAPGGKSLTHSAQPTPTSWPLGWSTPSRRQPRTWLVLVSVPQPTNQGGL
jgi:hypothetical protein